MWRYTGDQVYIVQWKPTSQFDDWLHDLAWPWPFYARTQKQRNICSKSHSMQFSPINEVNIVRRRSTVSAMWLCKSIQFDILFMANVFVWAGIGSCQCYCSTLGDDPTAGAVRKAESFCASAAKRIWKRQTIMRSTYTHVRCAFVFRFGRNVGQWRQSTRTLAELHSYGEHTHRHRRRLMHIQKGTENSAINSPFN